MSNSIQLSIFKNLFFYSVTLLLLVGCKMESKKSKPDNNSDLRSEKVTMFNGENLDGWNGDSSIWSVEEGCIVGRTTSDKPINQNTFLIYNSSVSDFEMSFQYKIIGGNSGVQYRAKVLDQEKFVVGGYQADMEAGNNYSGILYRAISYNVKEDTGTVDYDEMEELAIAEKPKNDSWWSICIF